MLAALLSVLAGPSAAAAYTEPTDGHGASIAGIAPNGDHATARTGHLVPVPSAVPGERVTLDLPVRTDVVAPTEPSMIPGAPDCAQRGRAPPAG
jgi:hypothetical protein